MADEGLTGSVYTDLLLLPFSVSYAALKTIGDVFEGPELPEQQDPPPIIEVGDEGIRRGEMRRMARTKDLQRLSLTRGQPRDEATLGGLRQTLG